MPNIYGNPDSVVIGLELLVMAALASARRLTALLIIFQILVILCFFMQYTSKTKSPYDYKKISKLLESPEFSLTKEELKAVEVGKDDEDNEDNETYDKLENNLEIKSDGQSENGGKIGWSEEDIKNENNRHKGELNNSEDIVDDSDDKTSDEDRVIKDLEIKYGEGNIYYKNRSKRRKQQKGSDFGDMVLNEIIKPKSVRKESLKERALVQFSGMGKLKKEISKKVKNPTGRFVSDKRILYSEVYEDVENPKDIQLLLIVSSSAKKRKRRDAIRATWWEECDSKKVKCLFFTDILNSTKLSGIKNELLHENRVYKDMVFQPIDVGVKFGYRFLYQMQWAVANYRFQYLLRVDDDIMLCLHRLLHDLKYFPKENTQWGTIHCDAENTVYIDEGITMFTRDLVMKFLSQNPFKMRCHVFGDQQIATWIQDLNLDASKIYLHDPRIHHTPAAFQMREYFLELEDICANHIAVHGTYPEEMEEFWAKKRTKKYDAFKREELSEHCERDPVYNWNAFKDEYKYQPKYCYKKPSWKNIILETKKGEFAGREERPDTEDLWSKMNFGN